MPRRSGGGSGRCWEAAVAERLRIGVVGAGMIAQVEHLPNLVALRDRFQIVAVADPSAHVREAIAARHGVATLGTLPELLERELDALLVAVPDPLHADAVLAGLDAGLAGELGASGRAAWQVLAAAVGPAAVTRARLRYDAAPVGVGYFVAGWWLS